VAAALDAGTSRSLAQRYARLVLDFFHATDMLVLYAVKRHDGGFAVGLAHLMYSIVFRHDIFRAFGSEHAPALPRMMRLWVKQLSHFLSYFPGTQKVLGPLRALQQQLQFACEHSTRASR